VPGGRGRWNRRPPSRSRPACGFGLHTCPQVAFARYHCVIRAEFGIAVSEVVVCGLSLGHADEAAPENALRTEREALEGFVEFLDR
jgi:nitroreductase